MATAAQPLAASPPPVWKPGPVTVRRQRRTLFGYFVVALIGLVPLLVAAPAGWQAVGIGLWLPGGGFIADGGFATLLFPLTIVLFALAVFAWFGAGAVIAPLLVWGGAAAIAGTLAGERIWGPSPYAVAAATALAFGALWYRARRIRTKDAATGIQRAAIMPMALAQARERASAQPSADEREMTDTQLASVRYLLDRGLQPVDQFDGFDHRDIFQTAAIRYQVNWVGSGLSTAQSIYTPSFHGYSSLAQRQLIEKYLNPRVWNYWIYESCWGHLNFTDWNPAAKDNIMLTGYYGGQVLLYMGATGDHQYAQPGSLTFRLNDRKAWPHDIHTICRSIYDNFKRSAYCLYPCEPNWIYPGCNFHGMRTLVAYDRVFGTDYVGEIGELWLRALDREFTTPAGSVLSLRSSITGFAFPFPGSDLGLSIMANTFAPERAMAMWAPIAMGMRRLLADHNGRTILNMPDVSLDFGNYRRGARTFAMGAMLLAANEFGDAELADAAQNTLDIMSERTERNGVLYYRKGSNLANCAIAQGRLLRRNDFRDLFAQGPVAGPAVFDGPILAEVAYPDVQVARAVSDGQDLDLVLVPTIQSDRFTIGVERLMPGKRYELAGGSANGFVADQTGRAKIDIALPGRTRLRIVPAL